MSASPGPPVKGARDGVPKASDRYESSDEESWTTSRHPLINTFSFGWTEDGRCGYAEGNSGSVAKFQSTPRPISAFSLERKSRNSLPYICSRAAAGSRHSVFLMIHCRKAPVGTPERKKKKVMITGLNQGLLCEEEGHSEPVDVFIEEEFFPVDVAAGLGTTFVIDKFGNVYSFGMGRYGILGHGNDESSQIPKQIHGLLKQRVRMVSIGDFHAMALTYSCKLWSWGRNHRGQLGRGIESDSCQFTPQPIPMFQESKYDVLDVACGDNHTIAIVRVKKRDNSSSTSAVFAWGDDSQLQLGSCDSRTRSTPNEVRWVSKFLAKKLDGVLPHRVAAGGGHNLLLTEGIGRVLSWGAGCYGQLGHGDSWDCAQPRLISNIVGVLAVFAGKRHSAAIVSKPHVDNEERKQKKRERLFAKMAESTSADDDLSVSSSATKPAVAGAASGSPKRRGRVTKKSLQRSQPPQEIIDGENPREHVDVYMWGYNGYGELGLGDTYIRMVPTLVTALQNARVRSLSLGDRHTLAITDHVPMLVRDVPDLKPFFEILKHNVSKSVKNVIRGQVSNLGYSADLMDTPGVSYLNQPGYNDAEIVNERYDQGLRYCMDTIEAPPELRWRRKGMETCYECPPLKLTSVCMACARRCQRDRLLIPRVRPRSSKDICDCRISGLCRCKYSHVREQFDRLITPTTGFKDECIGPNLLRTLLEKCLHPMPLENSDMEECLINLSEGDETAEVPRITAWNFENWYDQHFKRKPHI